MAADYNKAESEALRILKEFGVKGPPIDPEEIAEKMGVDVVYAKFRPPHDEEISGYIEFDPEPRIIVNSKIHPNRKTFTIAHELAHYIMHDKYARSGDYRVLPRRNEYNGSKPDEEREADAFAANLLVPRPYLNKYSPLASPRELSSMFLVSDQVITNRLKTVGRPF